ncbi:MAG: T9SS type A sorting domain-containing protein [Bacteroidetes bacterium]|nr:T9SS type A sorting domain-containing protein [Bacteroidota bacterium]
MTLFSKFPKSICFIVLFTLFFYAAHAQWTNSGCILGVNPYRFASTDTRLFFTNSFGLYVSDDHGDSWNHMQDGSGNEITGNLGANGSTIIVAYFDYTGTAHIQRSKDNGVTWEDISSGYEGYYSSIECVFITGNYVFLGLIGGILRSTNSGDSWTYMSTGLPESSIHAMTNIGTVLYAATDNGVYKSLSNGLTWTPAISGLPYSNHQALTIAPKNDTLYIGLASAGFYYSTDGATTWNSMGLAGRDVNKLVINGRWLYAATDQGVFKATVAGDWVSIGLTGKVLDEIAVSGTNIFAGEYLVLPPYWIPSGSLYQSTDNGAAWDGIHALTDPFVNVTFYTGSNVLAGTYSGIFHSQDNGSTWSVAIINVTVTDTACHVYGFTMNGSTLFAASSKGILKSTDGGSTWNLSGSSSPPSNTITFNNNKLFAGTPNGIYTSTNNGVNFSLNGLNGKSINCIFFANNTIYAGATDGVYESLDNGLSWSTSGLGIPGTVYSVGIAGGMLFAGTDIGVWKRLDTINPHVWISASAGIVSNSVFTVTGYNNLLFIGTSDGQVLMTKNSGTSWSYITDNIVVPMVPNIMIGANTIFASTSGNENCGIFKRSLGDFTGIEDQQPQAGFSIYPNPVNDNAEIVLNGNYQETLRVEIFSSDGKLISSIPVNNTENHQKIQINCSVYPQGIYFVRITGRNGAYVEKIIIRRQ